MDEGETLVISHLQRALPDHYLLYPNIEITEPERPPFEYDLMVVAPHAVYVVEVKRWLGKITGGDITWTLSSGTTRPNPLQSANFKARVLKGRLLRLNPALQPVWVQACVAIADDKTALQLTGAAAERTFLYPDLPAFLMDPARLTPTGRPILPNLIAHLRSDIRDAIEQEARARSHVPLRFGHYEVTDTLSRTELTDEYVARNVHLQHSAPVRLRVFADPPYVSQGEREARRQRIQRDAEALMALGPHPNLVGLRDFFQDDGGHGIEVTDWSETGTLRDLLVSARSLSDEQRLDLVLGISRGLAAAHAKGIIHRNLRPETILLSADLTPHLMNFDYARVDRPAAMTVWEPLAPDADRRYLAPELDRPNPTATPASDLYSLGALIYELYAGQVPYASPGELERAGGTPPPLATLCPDAPPALADLAASLYQSDRSQRLSSPDAVVERLQRLKTPPPQPVPPEEDATPTEYRKGEVISGEYKVLDKLGGGGFATVYHVFHQFTRTDYALKVINGHFALDRLIDEYQILHALNHPNIAKVTWAGRTGKDQFCLVVEYIDGYPLDAFIEPGHLLPLPDVVRLFKQLLSALEHIHQPKQERVAELRRRQEEGEELTEEEFAEFMEARQRYLHRDIKPQNLMLTRSGQLKVIDFNIAAMMGAALHYTQIGTPPFLAPDIQLLGWDESVDLFAAGVTLYMLVTGHHPYPNADPTASDTPENPQVYRPDLSDEFAFFLWQAVQPNRHDRFATAQAMHAALVALDGQWLQPEPPSVALDEAASPPLLGAYPFELRDWEKGKPNYNPFVTRLLTLYSQATRSNAGTRGLDEIARATYIPTWLDDRLRPDILAGRHRLVIITGNAGDGKTAFIQQLEDQARAQGATVEPLYHTNSQVNGSQFSLAGLNFRTNYDGSQDEGDRSNDEVLTAFLAPFAGDDPFARPDANARIIAINEGRLRDFLHTHRHQFPTLARLVTGFFDEEQPLPSGMLVVNLNWRAVTANGPASVFTRQLKRLVEPQFWTACEGCAFKDRCVLRANALRLADPLVGDAVVERLRAVFEMVYLRRRLHITMRDIRSALSYLLLHDQSCDDIARTLESGRLDGPDVDAKLDYLSRFYYNGLAAPDEPAAVVAAGGKTHLPEPPDRLVRLLVRLDPALVPNPDDDRALHFTTPQSLGASLLLGLQTTGYDQALITQVHQALLEREADNLFVPDHLRLAQRLRFHALLRRKSLFERRDDGWRAMLPYRYADEFLHHASATGGQSDARGVRTGIALAISTAQGMRHAAYARDFVSLRAGSNPKASIKSFRLFPVDHFRLRAPSLGPLAPYIEYTPDRLFFEHRDERKARLTISLDLFELLMQVGRGVVPSPTDLQGYFLNLTIFKNALAHLPYREVLLTENDQQFYRVWADDQNVVHMTEARPEEVAHAPEA